MADGNADFTMQGDQAKIVRISDRQKELDKLPSPETQRWVMRRKAQVVQGVRKGLLTMEEACARYRISEEEFKNWMRLLDGHGVRALRVTRLKDYRNGQLDEATSVAE
jgi:hypothetical protein